MSDDEKRKQLKINTFSRFRGLGHIFANIVIYTPSANFPKGI